MHKLNRHDWPSTWDGAMYDWNDLRHFLAVARAGSTVGAARHLKVNQSTVQRRVAELERQLGRALVERHPTGYSLTALGRAVLPMAEAVERANENFAKVINNDMLGREVIRLTCPEPVVGRLMPLIDAFHRSHPEIRVEIVTSDRYLDLLKGDADIALRSGDTDHDLTGRKIADSVWGVYASQRLVDERGRPARIEEIAGFPIATLDESMAPHRVVEWLKQVAPQAEVAARSSSMLGLVSAVQSGVGIAPLPMAIAEDAGLVKLFGPVVELGRTWRILTHPKLRRSRKITVFFDFVAKERKAFSKVFG